MDNNKNQPATGTQGEATGHRTAPAYDETSADNLRKNQPLKEGVTDDEDDEMTEGENTEGTGTGQPQRG